MISSKTSPSELKIYKAGSNELEELKQFYLQYGPTEFNPVNPEADIIEFDEIASGRTIAYAARLGSDLVGVATCNLHRKFPKYDTGFDGNTGYFSQYVVLPSHQGKGIGTHLVEACTEYLLGQGVDTIYVTHHADNLPSACALEKGGYAEADTYDDPVKRKTGSRKTTVRRFRRRAV